MSFFSRHKQLLLVVALVTFTVAAGVALLQGSSQQTTGPSKITSSQTPGVSSQEQALLEGLSKELTAKYFSYSRPDDPAYLASFKPYVSDRFYQVTTDEIKRYSGRLRNITAVTATPGVVTFDSITQNQAEVSVNVKQAYASGEKFDDTAYILWKRVDGRWVASYILTEKSPQNLAKYGE